MIKKKAGIMMLSLALALSVFALGCDTMGQNTKTGALGGALAGSVLGGVIGHQGGHGVGGALVGGSVGALAGGVIGNSIDQKKQVETQTVSVASREKMGISDVITLSKAGLTDDAIIGKIVDSGSVYNLSVEEIELLRKEGVSSRVVNYMMGTK